MESNKKINYIVKNYINPTLKEYGYVYKKGEWIAERKDYFVGLILNKSRWNNDRCGYTFWYDFNAIIKQEFGLKIYRSGGKLNLAIFIPPKEDREYRHDFLNIDGYTIDDYGKIMDVDEIGSIIQNDFREFILPKLEETQTLEDFLNLKEKLLYWKISLLSKKARLLQFYNEIFSYALGHFGTFDCNEKIDQAKKFYKLTAYDIKENMNIIGSIGREEYEVEEGNLLRSSAKSLVLEILKKF